VASELCPDRYHSGLSLRLIFAGGRSGRHTFAGEFLGVLFLVGLILGAQADGAQEDAG
jgi:hypothetical protein